MPENSVKSNYSLSALCVAVAAAVTGGVSLCAEMAAYAISATSGELSYTLVCVVFAAVSLITISPLIYGIKRRMFLAYYSHNTDVFEMFYLFGTKRYFRYILIKLIIYMRAFFLSAVFFSIARACFVVKGTAYAEFKALSGTALSAIGLSCVILGGLVFALLMAKAFMCDFIFTYNENCGVFKTLRASSKLMKGKMTALAFLIVKLSPLYLACLTLVAIPFVYPLILRKTTEFALTVKGDRI